MAYQALYRVWRSQTFQDLVGQRHITQTLQNALLQQKISHAYLFSGPRGTGKTSAARLLAKAINCAEAPALEPCNQCSACLGIMEGTVPDVLEIDAASNNGVEEIRDLRDKVKYVPSMTKYKVYIIDEVHMLSTGAFNALLKTLEEPPEHVIFILATTEPHKIPLTIHSRCQRYDFKQIAHEDIVERLKTVIDGIEVAYEKPALTIIARAAKGGMRDALSLLDQAISYSSDVVTEADALAVTGAVSQQFLTKMTTATLAGDSAEALRFLNELLSSGKDPVRFVEEAIFYYRDLLLQKVDADANPYADEESRQLAQKIANDDLYRYIEEWNKALVEMKWSSNPRIFLEVVVVKLCQPVISAESGSDSSLLQTLMDKIEVLENKIVELQQSTSNNNQPMQQVQAMPSMPMQEKRTSPIAKNQIFAILAQATKQDKENVLQHWAAIMETLYLEKSGQAAILDEAEPIAVSTDAFVLKFTHEIHYNLANKNGDIIHRIAELIEEKVGTRYEILLVSESNWLKAREEFIATQRGKAVEKPVTKEEPIVQKAKDLFGAEMIEIMD